ncbi:hypothetical protein AYL99_04474 [Fonsecaea erecta]|uniref:DUF7587 domain-containing protein n=1 Tax=Fonsecaea erecta TaxID=1367422 RepID=A0A178ZS51_9EURO|nr:hypothetical protein AYL99_04474 [Fonsecaea erecta]OAP62271.1 hypothetical protein AYL99_04474 [Fonsecaea erecta]
MSRLQNWPRYNQYLKEPYVCSDEGGSDWGICTNERLTHIHLGQGESGTPLETCAELRSKEEQRHPFRMVIYKRVSVEGLWKWKLCQHRVNLGAVSACTQGIPRYLFRFWHDDSAGENGDGLFKSERQKQDMCADLELMTERDIQESLLKHMHRAKGAFQSPWISLATSPLWVFSEALAAKQRGCQNIRLAIIDTWRIGPGAYIFQAEALLRAYNVAQSLPFFNMGEPMVLVWKEIRAPMTVVRLEGFLPSVLENGHRKPGYLKLQPFHHQPLDSEFSKTHSTKRKRREDESDNKRYGRRRKPREIREKLRLTKSTCEAFQEVALEQKAPWRFQWRHLAGRMTQGEQRGRKMENRRVSIAAYQLNEYVEFLKREVPAVEFQFPLLIAMLSTRTRELEYDSIVDAIHEWGSEDPMVRAHKRCIVRDRPSPDLPELTAFDKLFRDVSKRLGIPVDTNPGVRKFWVLQSPHTKIPEPRKDSERILHIVQGHEARHMRLKEEEEARRREAEKANARLCKRLEAKERREFQVSECLLARVLKELDDRPRDIGSAHSSASHGDIRQ